MAAAHGLSVAGCGVFSPNVWCLDPWPVIPPGPLGKEGRVSVRGPAGRPSGVTCAYMSPSPSQVGSRQSRRLRYLLPQPLPSVVSVFPSDTYDRYHTGPQHRPASPESPCLLSVLHSGPFPQCHTPTSHVAAQLSTWNAWLYCSFAPARA